MTELNIIKLVIMNLAENLPMEMATCEFEVENESINFDGMKTSDISKIFNEAYETIRDNITRGGLNKEIFLDTPEAEEISYDRILSGEKCMWSIWTTDTEGREHELLYLNVLAREYREYDEGDHEGHVTMVNIEPYLASDGRWLDRWLDQGGEDIYNAFERK